MTDEELKQAMAELQEVVRCRCDEAYRDRGLHDPQCECDSAEAVKIVARRIEDLEAKLAKAVEGLEKIAGAAVMEWTTARCGGLCDIARATLAEIKGESHE